MAPDIDDKGVVAFFCLFFVSCCCCCSGWGGGGVFAVCLFLIYLFISCYCHNRWNSQASIFDGFKSVFSCKSYTVSNAITASVMHVCSSLDLWPW